MLQHWWKILGVLLVLYTLIVGMIVPLKPGIPSVSPSNGKTGETITLQIEGYNTHFQEAKNMRAWLKMDGEKTLLADKLTATASNALQATFSIPKYLPSDKKVVDFALVIDNELDGASVLPSALFITQQQVQKAMGEGVWKNVAINNLHEYPGWHFPIGIS